METGMEYMVNEGFEIQRRFTFRVNYLSFHEIEFVPYWLLEMATGD